jgi:hypothetical protein
MNFSLPVPFSGILGPALFTTSALDFKLLDGGLWIGEAQVSARRGAIFAFLGAEANAKKNVRVATPAEPFWAELFPVEWRGTRLEWWAIDGGGGLELCNAVSILGGFRAEHLSLGLADPIDPTGQIQFFQATFGDRYSGDVMSKLWIPYIGLQTRGQCWKGAVRFSAVVWTNLKVPFRYLLVDLPRPDLYFEEARYDFKRGGLWLDARFDYDVRVASSFTCGLWLTGSWLRIRGQGTEGYRLDTLIGGVPAAGVLTDSGSETGVYTSYTYGLGVRGELAF